MAQWVFNGKLSFKKAKTSNIIQEGFSAKDREIIKSVLMFYINYTSLSDFLFKCMYHVC